MSVRWTRSAQISRSRVPEAIAWSKEICAVIGKKHHVAVDTWLDVVGPLATIRWSVDYPDVATFDKTMTAVLADPEYWQFVDRANKAELFIDGVGSDTLSKKV
jgi:NIPSNAP protein